MQEELGLDTVDAGRVQEQFEQVLEEAFFDLAAGGFVMQAGAEDFFRQREDIPDDGFGVFVDAEDVAGDAAGVYGDVAGEGAGVEILEEKLGGGEIVPVEALLPEGALSFEHRAQHGRGEVSQIENLQRKTGCHAMPQDGARATPRLQHGELVLAAGLVSKTCVQPAIILHYGDCEEGYSSSGSAFQKHDFAGEHKFHLQLVDSRGYGSDLNLAAAYQVDD